jgi:hypothetical protein
MNVTAQRIAFLCLILSTGLMTFLFAESRSDPSLRIAALVAGTGLVSSLAAIASTMLTGKDLTHRDPGDLPPGSTMQSSQQSVIKTPPITTTSSDTEVLTPKV